MLRRLYDWTLQLAENRNATWVLAFVAFIESSIFPIPVDAFLIPMVLAKREKAWLYAAICTFMSVLGGFAGYVIGWLFFEQIAMSILAFYGYLDKFEIFSLRYNEWGAWIVFFAGLTPFPYKVITIASGATGLSLPVFIIASILARGLRFFAVAGLLYWFGPPIRHFIEKHLGLVFTLALICLIGGFVALHYL